MNFVQRKATTNISKFSISNFGEVKKSFLTSLHQIIMMENIPPRLVFNWDQTGIMIVPSTSCTMDQRGAKRVEITCFKDNQQITAVFCGFLPVQVIYKGTTQRYHACFKLLLGWHVTI